MKGFKPPFFLLLSAIISQSAYAEKLSLVAFLERTRAQNLDLKIEAARSDAADAKSIGINLPPPMVGINEMKESNGNKAKGYEISQTVPFLTKLWGDAAARRYQAKSQAETRRGRENEILAQARLLYFSLWSAQEKLSLLTEKKTLLKEHIRLSRSTARSDSFAGVHLLKAESDFDLLENEILSLEQAVREKQAEIAVFLNVDPANFKLDTSEPPIPDIPKLESIETSHQLQALKFNLESLESRELEAKSSWLPDFTARYKQMGPTSMAGRYNEIMISATVPFAFPWEPYSASRQASRQRAEAEFTLEKQRRALEADRQTLSTKAESLKKQLSTFKEKLIPRAEKRMKFAHNLVPRDLETLQDHREAMEALPELKMQSLEIRLQYEQAVAALEKYLMNKGSLDE